MVRMSISLWLGDLRKATGLAGSARSETERCEVEPGGRSAACHVASVAASEGRRRRPYIFRALEHRLVALRGIDRRSRWRSILPIVGEFRFGAQRLPQLLTMRSSGIAAFKNLNDRGRS